MPKKIFQRNLPGIRTTPRSIMEDWVPVPYRGRVSPNLQSQLHGRIPTPNPAPNPFQSRFDFSGLAGEETGMVPYRGRYFNEGLNPINDAPTGIVRTGRNLPGPKLPDIEIYDTPTPAPKPTGLMSKLKGFAGRLGGPIAAYSLASALQDAFGTADPYAFNKGYDSGKLGPKPGTGMGDFSKNPTGAAAALASLEDLSTADSGGGTKDPRDINLPASGMPKKPKPTIKRKTALSTKFPVPNIPVDTGNFDFTQLPEITSLDIPNQVPLAARDVSNVFGNDSRFPDTQQSGKDSLPSAFDRYSELINNMPTREGSKPSVWRRIAAALAGFGTGYTQGGSTGFKTAQAIVDNPYDKKLSDWQTKVQELEPLVRVEAQREMNTERVEAQREKTMLINQTKSMELEIDKAYKEGRIKNEAERTLAQRAIAEARQLIANGQLELGKERLSEVAKYHQAIAGIQRMNAGANVTKANNSVKIGKAQIDNYNSQIEHRKNQDAVDSILNDILSKPKGGGK